MGIDITKNIKTGKTDYETYQLNVENDACIGGPKCRYNGKKIHCFVCSSPNTSITSGLLAMMLQQKDDLGVFFTIRRRRCTIPSSRWTRK